MIKIDLNPADVEQVIKEAIVNSAIGTKLREAVFKSLQSYELERAIEAVIKDNMARMAQDIIEKDLDLKARMKTTILDKLLDETFMDALSTRVAKVIKDGY